MKASDTMYFIGRLFADLSPSLKIEMLSVLYYDLRDYDRDKFLNSIEQH
jgi:hypothetical protein